MNECGLWEIVIGGFGRVEDFEVLWLLDDVCLVMWDFEFGFLVLIGFVWEDIDCILERLWLLNVEMKCMKLVWFVVRDICIMDYFDLKELFYDYDCWGVVDGVLVYWVCLRV